MEVESLEEPVNNDLIFKESVSGNKWLIKEYDERIVKTISQKHDLPLFLSQIIASKNIEIEEIDNYLNLQ